MYTTCGCRQGRLGSVKPGRPSCRTKRRPRRRTRTAVGNVAAEVGHRVRGACEEHRPRQGLASSSRSRPSQWRQRRRVYRPRNPAQSCPFCLQFEPRLCCFCVLTGGLSPTRTGLLSVSAVQPPEVHRCACAPRSACPLPRSAFPAAPDCSSRTYGPPAPARTPSCNLGTCSSGSTTIKAAPPLSCVDLAVARPNPRYSASTRPDRPARRGDPSGDASRAPEATLRDPRSWDRSSRRRRSSTRT
jgi:hypothetical protein